jgi:hypothetical protein
LTPVYNTTNIETVPTVARKPRNKFLAQTAMAVAIALTTVVVVIPAIQEDAAASSEAWVGLPFDGSWPSSANCYDAKHQSAACSLPFAHWRPYGGDWAVDLLKAKDTPVLLYVAPQTASHTIKAKVVSVGNACTSGSGGKRVTVAIYRVTSGIYEVLGTVIYAHLNTSLTAGTWITNRWGGELGTVFSTSSDQPGCWYGSHVHMEFNNMFDRSCFSGFFEPSEGNLTAKPTAYGVNDFLGFIGGNRIGNPSVPTPCPSFGRPA